MRTVFIFLACHMVSICSGQQLSKIEIDELANSSFLEGVTTLSEFLTLPNYGGNQQNIDQNVDWCIEMFQNVGFKTETLISSEVKHVFATRIFDINKPTILFYLQIDGQPVDSAKWFQESPYIPVLKECIAEECWEIGWDRIEKDWNPDWKIFSRSASDSKGPAVAFLQSLTTLYNKDIEPASNIKVIMDFQEELGSPTLPALVIANRDKFAADAMLIMDGTRPPGNLPTLTFGARGIATMKLIVYGARDNLHSGQYGNYAPNPAFTLARLLGAMKDEEGRVLIPDFYAGINLSNEQKLSINSVPEDREELLSDLGISKEESIGDSYQEALQYPSLNIRGLAAGWVEKEVRTIIPSTAIAEIDMRLVPETPAERQIELVKAFIRSNGFYVLDRAPTDDERARYSKIISVTSRVGSMPFRTDLNSPLGEWLGTAMAHVFGEGNYIRMQSTGGSQPIAPFINTLGIPAISVRISNPDNSIHAPNENLRIGNFYEGLQMCLAILTRPYE